jgi:hypothetical protein
MNPVLVGRLLVFLADNVELVMAIIQAIEAGASRDAIRAAIKAAQIEASDAAMREEIGG